MPGQVPLPLYDILALDEENLTVTVEPMVTVSSSKLCSSKYEERGLLKSIFQSNED